MSEELLGAYNKAEGLRLQAQTSILELQAQLSDLQKLCEEQKGEIAGRKKQYELVKKIQMSLEKELDTWKEVVAENERQRVKWMKQSEHLESQLATQTERVRVMREALRGIVDSHMSCEQPTEAEEREVHRMFHIAQQALNQESLGDVK